MALQGIAHKNLTDPQLHELKGASTAEVNQVPFADGDGSSHWNHITLDKVVIEPTELSEADDNSSTDGTALDILALSAVTNGTCGDAANFTGVNKNTKELAVKVNALITYANSLKASYNGLVTKYNALLAALEEHGLITIEE